MACYKKTYLIHEDENCKYAKTLRCYGPFKSVEKGKEYIDWRNTMSKKKVYCMPFLFESKPNDEISRQMDEMVRYALVNEGLLMKLENQMWWCNAQDGKRDVVRLL
jgi:hypothetical protein